MRILISLIALMALVACTDVAEPDTKEHISGDRSEASAVAVTTTPANTVSAVKKNQSATEKDHKVTILGRWCDTAIPTMQELDYIIEIRKSVGDLTISIEFHGNRPGVKTVLTKKNGAWHKNDSGDYYKIRADGALGLYDRDGWIRDAKTVGAKAKPGSCRRD